MNAPDSLADDSINFPEILGRLRRGLPLTIGLIFLGVATGITLGLVSSYRQPAVSTLRVTFGFPGFEHGRYPNGTKFQPDDVRAPDVINEAIGHLGLENKASELSSRIRGAIIISGIVSPSLIKERDRLRASGQAVSPLIPDEYELSLSLPRDQSFSIRQRELLLTEIVNAYRNKFTRTYVELPPDFGNAFKSLSGADFSEYELVLTKELQALTAYLEQQIVISRQFRSSTNHLSFQDLLKQAELFSQIKLNQVLSRIYMDGLSTDRGNALLKMDYFLHNLEAQENRLKDEEQVIANLLSQTQSRAQNYVLAAKSQVSQTNQPLVDQAFIDSLLANDAYNFLIRKDLDAGLALKRLQAEKAQLFERRQRMDSFIKGQTKVQANEFTEVSAGLKKLEADYDELLSKVHICLMDYSDQEYSDSVRISMQASTPTIYSGGVLGATAGGVVGIALGLGLSLLAFGLSPADRSRS